MGHRSRPLCFKVASDRLVAVTRAPTPDSRLLPLLPTRYSLLSVPTLTPYPLLPIPYSYSYSHSYSYFNLIITIIIIIKSTRNNLIGIVIGVGSRESKVGVESRDWGLGSREPGVGVGSRE